MIQIFSFIVAFLPDLFEKYGFVICSSANSGNRFGGASIVMASGDVEVFLSIERDEITLSFRSLFDEKKNWFSTETVLALLGHKGYSGVINDQSAVLLRDELPKIMKRFDKAEAGETVRLLCEIKKTRVRV